MSTSIVYAVADGIARITLNRPEKRNALNPALIGELRDALSESARDEAVRVVVLNGAGPDFCAGLDLSSVTATTPLENLADASALADVLLALRRHPHPVIAAVHGRALAGGCGLATACDIILAAESAQFGYPEVNIGFVPAMVMALLRRAVPEKAAFELIVMGEVLPASRMAELGIVQRVFANDVFDKFVGDYAGLLAKKSPSAVTLSKRLLYHTDNMSFEAALDAGAEINALARMTDDFRQGIARFQKK